MEADAKKVAKMMETQIKALAKDRSERIPKGPEPETDPGQGGRGFDGGVVVEGEREVERGEMDGQQLTEGVEGGGSKEPTPPKDRQYQLLQEQQQQYYQDPQYAAQTYQDTGVQYQEQVIQYQDQQQQQYHSMGLQQHMSADQAACGVQHQQQQQYQDMRQYMEVQNILPQDQYSNRHLPTLEEQPREPLPVQETVHQQQQDQPKATAQGPPPQLYQAEYQHEVAKQLQEQVMDQQRQQQQLQQQQQQQQIQQLQHQQLQQ